MATNVKILLRRGKRAELSGQILSPGEMGYTTDTNQLYVGIEEAVNEIRFDPFANAHATIQAWLDSADCPVANLTIDEDLIIQDIPAGQIDNIVTALNTYTQTIVFNSAVATFNLTELLTQYKKKPTTLTSPNLVPNVSSITSTFTVEGETITVSAVTLTSLLTTLQANAAIKAANVEVTLNSTSNKIIFTKIDGLELNLTFSNAASATAVGFTQSILPINAGSFVVGTSYTITSLGTDTLATVTSGSFVIGTVYTILVPGTTDFVAEQGAADSLAGTVFTATATGSGNGTATKVASTIQTNWEAAGAPAVDVAGSFKVGTIYSIVAPGTTDFTTIGAANSNVGTTFTATNVGIEEITSGNFVVGRQYTISTTGNTDFTLIGAANSNVGTLFTATGVGIGTGVANYQGTGTATSVLVGTVFTATAVGQGDGIATYDNGVNTVAAISGYDVYANGKIKSSTPGSGITTVTVEVDENSDYFSIQQEGTGAKPYANAPDNSPYYYFGTPSTPNYSTLSPSVESTSITGTTDTKIGLFGHKRKNVEVLTEESRNQLFTNQHLKSYSSATGLRSDLFKKSLNVTVAVINATACVEGKQYEIVSAGTTNFTLNGSANSTVGTRFYANATAPVGTGTVKQIGTFLKYPKADCTSFFIDYSLKQSDSTNMFVRVGTLRVINGVPQGIAIAQISDENTEVWQDLNSDSIKDVATEFSNIVFVVKLQGDNIEINYTQNANNLTEISYTVKRWTM
jgi:hypothetical protein|tara:strand:+ start:22 stop:2253 length:2232 start_codon:yes stop_codon:yes gene_type:complete